MSRFSAADRLTRLLAVIPWVARHGGTTLDEIATKFSYPKDELVSDLTDVVQFVGVPAGVCNPYPFGFRLPA